MAQIKLVFISLLVLLLTPVLLYAKGGSEAEDRKTIIGIIHSMPSNGMHGDWTIGDYTISTVPGTEFDQTDGPLTADGCAKVKLRNGIVHEIDSEPLSDCK